MKTFLFFLVIINMAIFTFMACINVKKANNYKGALELSQAMIGDGFSPSDAFEEAYQVYDIDYPYLYTNGASNEDTTKTLF